MNVAELEGYALDAAVAEAEGHDWDMNLTLGGRTVLVAGMTRNYSPSTEWWYGGPIIQRERIAISCHAFGGGAYLPEGPELWAAHTLGAMPRCGHTPLIAAMRAYVASKL